MFNRARLRGFTHASIRRFPLTFSRARSGGKWHVKTATQPAIGTDRGARMLWKDTKCQSCQEMHRAKGLSEQLKNFGIISPASTSPYKPRTAFLSPLSQARAKIQQWSETGGSDRTHLSLRHFTRELFFTECGVKPESPGEEFKLPRNTGSISEHPR